MRTLPFWLVDVFAREPLSGNSLSVFLLDADLTALTMQRITQEMRQFETIFLRQAEHSSRFHARIFTMEEELPFAGHPVIGAATVIHSQLFPTRQQVQLDLVTPAREIPVTSNREGSAYSAEMDQGLVEITATATHNQEEEFARALNLSSADLAPGLPLQVVSTGLAYLIVPIRANIEHAKIVVPDLEEMLGRIGAKFVYVLDVAQREGRTWENDGRSEDIATGSAAGPVAAYLVAHGLAQPGEALTLKQGRFMNRPSELHAEVRRSSALSATVRGRVCFSGSGALRLPERVLQGQ